MQNKFAEDDTFLFAYALKKVIFLDVASVLRKVEGVNTASGTCGTKGLLLFSRIIQSYPNVILLP